MEIDGEYYRSQEEFDEALRFGKKGEALALALMRQLFSGAKFVDYCNRTELSTEPGKTQGASIYVNGQRRIKYDYACEFGDKLWDEEIKTRGDLWQNKTEDMEDALCFSIRQDELAEALKTKELRKRNAYFHLVIPSGLLTKQLKEVEANHADLISEGKASGARRAMKEIKALKVVIEDNGGDRTDHHLWLDLVKLQDRPVRTHKNEKTNTPMCDIQITLFSREHPEKQAQESDQDPIASPIEIKNSKHMPADKEETAYARVYIPVTLQEALEKKYPGKGKYNRKLGEFLVKHQDELLHGGQHQQAAFESKETPVAAQKKDYTEKDWENMRRLLKLYDDAKAEGFGLTKLS